MAFLPTNLKKCTKSKFGHIIAGKGKGKVFYGQEAPSGESTTTEVGSIINYYQ